LQIMAKRDAKEEKLAVKTEDKKKELIKKLQALAERGVGGEKETAKKKLEQLMEKYNINSACIEEDVKDFHDFKYAGKWEEKLLVQVIAHVMGSAEDIRQRPSGKGSRSVFLVDCTQTEALQIGVEFDFYKVLMAEDMDIFFSAFIHKHKLFGRSRNRQYESPTDEEMEKAARIFEMMKGMQDRSPITMLEVQ